MTSSPQFLFAVCQLGAELALKQEIERQHPALRFSFSRPGFVTFRLAATGRDGPNIELDSVFARTWGFSLGRVAAADERLLARQFWQEQGAHLPAETLAASAHLHVWSRDRILPGDTPAAEPAAESAIADRVAAAGAALLEARPTGAKLVLNAHANDGDPVLDCVLVEPREWWLGWHRVRSVPARWPGGVPNLAAPPGMISRAYLKLQEALLWSELPVAAGDRCIEIGSAPGGACQALLERGCIVTGIDPAEMDGAVLAQPRFTHLRARAKELKRSVFRDCRWLIADANVAPNYTLDTVEAVVTHSGNDIEGLLLTLKLTDPKLAAKLPAFCERIRSWGYRRVRARQLAFNRQEVCVAATNRAPTTR